MNAWEFYMEMPPVTRAYITACVLTTLAVQLDLLSAFQLYFNWTLIVYKGQVWRLVTSFCFFGHFGLSFVFNMIFTFRYCQMLEEGSFLGRRADFVYMFLLGGLVMIIAGIWVQLAFLGQAFTIMLVYIWSRRNPHIRMNFFGVLNFSAPYLPWVLLLFSVLLGNNALVDFLGIAAGHVYWFLEDVFPRQEGGLRLLETPRWLHWLCDERDEDPVVVPLGDGELNDVPRPGGFDWTDNNRDEQQPPQRRQQQAGRGDDGDDGDE